METPGFYLSFIVVLAATKPGVNSQQCRVTTVFSGSISFLQEAFFILVLSPLACVYKHASGDSTINQYRLLKTALGVKPHEK